MKQLAASGRLTRRPSTEVRVDTHMLSACITLDAYPTSAPDRRGISQEYGPCLVQEWVDRGLPLDDLYLLIYRPGQIGPSEAQCIHRADQASGLAAEFGGVPVVLALSNTPVDPDLLVSRVCFD